MTPLLELLYKQHLISEEQKAEIALWPFHSTKLLEEKLIQNGIVLEEDLNQSIALLLNIPIVTQLPSKSAIPASCQKVPYEFVKKHLLLPCQETPDRLFALSPLPRNSMAAAELSLLLGKQVELSFCRKALFESWTQIVFSEEDSSLTTYDYETPHFASVAKTSSEPTHQEYDLFDKQESPIAELVHTILKEAIDRQASDIHFEPQEKGLQVRYRIDGVLQNHSLPSSISSSQMISRLKVMAQLDIAQKRLPQDGRVSLRMGSRTIDLRLSIVPVAYGERAVVRILDTTKTLLSLPQLQMKEIEADFISHINRSEGLLIVTGPTGVGKSRTLYSAISYLNKEGINIMTIEDPIEYRIKGISQMAVNTKIDLDFAKGLRHLLRQDPDILMIGEIRDSLTAKIAIQSALTGHLVLSTLHTNDAPSAIPRLIEMGIEPYLVSSCLIAVLAQRLVRLICLECKESYLPSKQEQADFGIKDQTLIYKGRGCKACLGSGYRGRVAIFEFCPISSALQKQITLSPEGNLLKEIAKQEGMKTLKDQGQRLIEEGATTTFEIKRVLG